MSLFVVFALAMNMSILPNNGLPMGNAIEANLNLPCNFRRRVIETHLSCLTALNSARTLSHLVVGSSMVNAIPSSNQPRIPFLVSHVPSKMSLFTLIRGPILLPVTDGGGKISDIAFKRLLVSCVM